MTIEELLQNSLIVSGIGHIILCAGSFIIPKALQWKTNLKSLKPLLRQMFWTYAGYILVTNFAFGIVSVFGSEELINRSFLATSITFFIALYWLARVVIQFAYFDRSEAPKGTIYTLGEIVLVVLFFIFTGVYSLAAFYNMSWI
jgi:hypothetical protein